MASRRSLQRALSFAPPLLVTAYITLAFYERWIRSRRDLIFLIGLLILTTAFPVLGRIHRLRRLFRRKLWTRVVGIVALLLLGGLFLAVWKKWVN